MATAASYPNTHHADGYNHNSTVANQQYDRRNGDYEDDVVSLPSRNATRRSRYDNDSSSLAAAHNIGRTIRTHFNAAVEGAKTTNHHDVENGPVDVTYTNGEYRGDSARNNGRYDNGYVPGAPNDRTSRAFENNRNSNQTTRNEIARTAEGTGQVRARKGRVVHNNNLLNLLDPRVHPADRKAWARGDFLDPPPGFKRGEDGRLFNAYGESIDARTATGPTGRYPGEQPAHNSRLMNRLDPRVDADAHDTRGIADARDTRQGDIAAVNNANNRTSNRYSSYDDQPVHSSALMNKLDPRVDENSTLAQQADGTHPTRSSAANNTRDGRYAPISEQPVHRSSLMNKLDPRVDDEALAARGPTSAAVNDEVCAHCGNTYNAASRRERKEHVGAVHGTTDTYNDARSSNYGPHSSNVGNKLDPRVDETGRQGAYNNTSNNASTYDNPRSSNYGPHSSAVANTLDPRVDETGRQGAYNNTSTNNATYDNPRSSNYGPHSSAIANTLDPNVDSSAGQGRYNTTNTNTNNANYDNPRSSNYGPHSSAIANTLDPNVDSTGRAATERKAVPNGNTYNNPQSSNFGPHSSNLANKLDPSVDSSAAGRNVQNAQYDNPQSTATSGPHNSNVANVLDPNVNSTGNRGYNGTTAGNTNQYDNPRSTNAGPHSSNLANKLDPSVDSTANQPRYTY